METIEKEATTDLIWNLSGTFLLADTLRSKAIETIRVTPFPTSKTEAWKYTRVSKIKNTAFQSQSNLIEITGDYGISKDALQLVFVNGHFSKKLSSESIPEGLKIEALSQMDPSEVAVFGQNTKIENDLFTAINTAYSTDGLYIHVSAKMQIKPTIEIITLNTGNQIISNLRNIIVAEAFSEVNLISRSISITGENNFTNIVNEIHVGKNAKLTLNKLQEENDTCYHICTEFVEQEQDSDFKINTVTLNGGLVRNNLNIDVNGKNCETHLNSAYILKGNQHVDNHTVVDHKVANCESNELYKGVIDENATAVFNGKVFVRKDAQKINAYQSNANVLLSESASVNSKPELEIYADDVKCSHGSTTGQLNDEAIFYLRARGISESSAKQLLVGAFIEDVLQKIDNEDLIHLIHQQIEKRFNWVLE